MSRAISLTAALIIVTVGLFGLAVGAWARDETIQPDVVQ
jgi:hypothetical protein